MEARRFEGEYEMSEMQRAIIIAKGKVQKVGYRDFVQDMARELSMTGYVENLKDGNIKIVCEGEEDNVKEFTKKIKVKKDFINVINVSAEYEKPTREFEIFEIKYGSVPEELGDRLGAAILYLGNTNRRIDSGNKMLAEKMDSSTKMLVEKQGKMLEKQDQMLGKQGKMLEKQDETVNILKQSNQEMKEFRQDTMQRFDIIDAKYGKIAENIEKAIEAINRTCTNTERLLEKTERDRKDFRDAIDKLADAIMSKK
jgi:acylphosphatase